MTMSTKVDFSGVGDFDPLPEGDYSVRFEKFEAGTIQSGDNKGAPKINLTFIVTDEGEYEGRKVWRTFPLTAKALWAFKKAAIAMGADPEDFDGEVDVPALLGSLVGADVVCAVEQREYEGKVRNDVTEIKDPSSSMLFR